jgi:hypothetical protein
MLPLLWWCSGHCRGSHLATAQRGCAAFVDSQLQALVDPNALQHGQRHRTERIHARV